MNIPKYTEQYRKDLLFKNYANSTIDNYVFQVDLFLRHFDNNVTEPSKINENQIKEWLMLAKTINSRKHKISALKLFYKYTIKQPLKFKNIEYPRSEQHLPIPLSDREVRLMFEGCDNLKHKSILGLLFLSGLRVGEVLRLKPEHIDRGNMLIHIKQGKGMKDRIVPMSEYLLKLLEDYYRAYTPSVYMFNGQFGDMYSERSVNQFIKQIARKAGINKRVHSHLGRHSCFTKMVENGIDMAIIQKIAGHNNIRTTQIYAKLSSEIIAKVKSFDFK